MPPSPTLDKIRYGPMDCGISDIRRAMPVWSALAYPSHAQSAIRVVGAGEESVLGHERLRRGGQRFQRVHIGSAGDAAFGEDRGDVARGRDVESGMSGMDV